MNNADMENPFLVEYDTPFASVPFNKIKGQDYENGVICGIEEAKREIDQIVCCKDLPTFENTILALEKSGSVLRRVTDVFFNIIEAETTDALDELAEKLSPLLTEHANSITANAELFKRVKYVYENGRNSLDDEQVKLLDDIYENFLREGAGLDSEGKKTYAQLTESLNLLELKFSQNKQKDINGFVLNVTSSSDLSGLPQSAINQAKETATNRGLDGWAFTLHAPSYIPFMGYCDNEELRKQMYYAYNTICTHDNGYNNQDVVREIVNIRRKIAQLLGYKNYAEYVLSKRMANSAVVVVDFLHSLLDSYKTRAVDEVKEVECYAKRLTGSDSYQLTPWDFSYYSNKLKEYKFNVNSELLRPYFELSRVLNAVFNLSTRLYGISFVRNRDLPVYHEDVEAYEVYDEDGTFLALLYCDFYSRPSKKPGAWMTMFKEQWMDDEMCDSRPHVSIVMNFAKPTSEIPSLLSLEEVETLLHEFGHSLHAMFSKVKYRSLSCTNVLWDFVELPSQIMENYSVEPDFLKTFARHYQTGELLSDEIIDKIRESRNFNVAYQCLRQLSFGLLDMAYYMLTEDFTEDIENFEKEVMKCSRVLPYVTGTSMSVQFSHIMSGGYSSGYYSYKWAEVLDADAFEVFKKNGIFDNDTANLFRKEILSKGGVSHPLDLYMRFRGKAPSINALLRRNGII